ncbi:MAG TPA: efflux RND transporter periplasmic adaptor subunit [Terriglobales bacterium]|nr:efflux RND transporter periplasmic adaptor subunit [Terriglobales bacterium]
MMKLISKRWIWFVGVVLAVAVLAAFVAKRPKPVQYTTAKVVKGDIRDEVQATGTINAVTTVQVGSQVSGTISEIDADFNAKVKKGQVIAKIDPSIFEGQLVQAQADLANSVANVAAAKANVARADAAAAQSAQDYQRAVTLTNAGVIAQQQLDAAKATNDSNIAAVNAAKAAMQQAEAQRKQKAAAVTVAQTNVNNTIIRAPIDGTVIARSVDVGQTVAASLQAPTLFTIAQDLTKMQVYTNTDESDVGMIKPGQKVEFRVDAFPKQTFAGVVEEVRMNATTVQNVVTYNTVVNFDNPEMKLFPGMTAYVTIPVATATDALEVPDAALRYKPGMSSAEVQAAFQKIGSTGGGRRSGGQRSNGTSSVATLWKLGQNSELEPVVVKTGITDHTNTEVAQVLKGSLEPGDQLVTGKIGGSTFKSTSSSPLTPGGRRPAGR